MIADIALVVAGLVLLVGAGDALVRGATALSLRLGMSPLVVGLTVVAFGTSAPEMIVSVIAALDGVPEIALGNVVGSNIANILLVLGATAAISGVATRGADLRQSWVMMMGASLVLLALGFAGVLVWWHGLAMLAALVGIVAMQIRSGTAEAQLEVGVMGWPRTLGWLLGGLVLLPVAAQMLVRGASDIALAFGVSQTVIGLTLVAVGTSLPELVASVVAALRGRGDLALGNVVGSNIFNILSILGVTALIRPLPVPPEMLSRDLWVMLAAALAIGPFLWLGWRIGRLAGGAMIAVYAAYLWVLV
ncbi:calcium/sodium antiporter [Paracoccus jiaweipingae]|uniref:calcium/sodium antiporter n=1 Tax=unclassified Paracoccus (in: a-proteobacteria) TaxID=2688777 RepID=UPI0037B3D1CC